MGRSQPAVACRDSARIALVEPAAPGSDFAAWRLSGEARSGSCQAWPADKE